MDILTRIEKIQRQSDKDNTLVILSMITEKDIWEIQEEKLLKVNDILYRATQILIEVYLTDEGAFLEYHGVCSKGLFQVVNRRYIDLFSQMSKEKIRSIPHSERRFVCSLLYNIASWFAFCITTREERNQKINKG